MKRLFGDSFFFFAYLIVMKRERLGEALTGDHHFKQAGFTTLFD